MPVITRSDYFGLWRGKLKTTAARVDAKVPCEKPILQRCRDITQGKTLPCNLLPGTLKFRGTRITKEEREKETRRKKEKKKRKERKRKREKIK